jgi:hypothetical protein
MFGKKYRFRSADSILAEIREKRPRKISSRRQHRRQQGA